jgi:hypothetical protein
LSKKLRAKNKSRIRDLFGGKCSLCGYSKIPDTLELHHVEKGRHNWTRIRDWKWESLKEEVLKNCSLLCSNCHSEYHWLKRQGVVYAN